MSLAHSNLHPLAVLGKAPHPTGRLRGYCNTTYAALCALLGKPHEFDLDKVNVEWAFLCNDGTTFHVYDWKLPAIPEDPYDWHIGGSSDSALDAFRRFTGLPVIHARSVLCLPSSRADQQNDSPQAQGQPA